MVTRSVSITLLIALLHLPSPRAQQSGSTIPTPRIFAAMGLHAGQTVCEMGAGNGDLTLAAAEQVAPSGRVYTSELGEDRIRTLRQNVSDRAKVPVTVVAGDPTRTNFPDAACDALFMRNVYHHFADPAAITASIRAAVKPGGRVAVVDFSPTGREAARPADRASEGTHGVSAESVVRELKEAGFEPVSSEAASERWFMVVVAKPGG